jgi:hypothetical protein
MDQNERQVIDELFGKVRQAEQGSGPRDPAAEQHIMAKLQTQPAAPYYMAQAIVVQEHALQAAQARIEQLEGEIQARPAGGGGFLSGLFGGGAQPAATPGHLPAQPMTPGMQRLQQYQRPGMGGSFLGGAMQTAMGVAGGLVLGNLLMGAFASDPAAAAEMADPTGGMVEEPGFEDAGADEEF